ncbi:hypothetical protein OsI_06596 [Oryza sativa Indica Group]|uniref:BED-type domain-containing protein n=1 Tax=Oryza sativa subsp. indica TaxID=39946 RepID=B8AFC5_ORYSI|nr:hypothetical protein OsI_06596 [Oryza sativa Indica Group]
MEENNYQPARRAGRRKRSEVWDHFEQKAECNYCKALLCADPARDGTSRLKKHYGETCPARHPNKSGRDHFIRMIALHGFPSSMVEDKQFIRFVGMLCPDFKMPSRDDVEERCDALFDQETSSLKDAIARRARTAMVDTVYLAAHFIDDEWNLCRRVIRVFKDNAEIAGLVGDDTFQETVTSELFRTTLGMIYNAIETVAGSSSPTSNLSLIELVKLKINKCTNASRRKDDNDDEDTDEEEIDDSDDEGIDEEQTNDARCSFKKLKEYLNKVSEKTYLSQSIPLILDPRFKLVKVERLLENASLPPDRISEVQAAVVQLFQDYSNQGNAREHTNHNNENVMDIDPFHQIHNSTFQTVGQPSMEHDHRSSQESITELDAFLREKTVPIKQENFDILKWWKENYHRYPIVARMARDFLAIPTSTGPTPQMMTKITNHLRRYA